MGERHIANHTNIISYNISIIQDDYDEEEVNQKAIWCASNQGDGDQFISRP